MLRSSFLQWGGLRKIIQLVKVCIVFNRAAVVFTLSATWLLLCGRNTNVFKL